MADTMDLSEELRLVLKSFEDTGIPVQTWTTTELARHFITTESFIASVKTITRSNKIVHDNVMSLAIQRGFWAENRKCAPMAMMKFCIFLKSKEGSEFLDCFQKKAELSTRFMDLFNTGYALMLVRQVSELEAARKGRIAEIEADIADHRSKIVLLEKQLEKEIVEVERRYLPASQYVPLDEQELLKRCYDMYVDECTRNEEMMRELDQELIEFIKSKYEKEVRMLYISDFMADEKRKRLLKVWNYERINKTGDVSP
ncbi:hypothetical protein L195_g052897 [Trifolium pratense]|uniref:Uncharacterized protein n=2 Tax=Trifolium pratense TaxID=57577 RepID=A0A2K3K7L9_TRIPR|nr:hypothetical protein L195_g052897 [Trifolium pratense]